MEAEELTAEAHPIEGMYGKQLGNNPDTHQNKNAQSGAHLSIH